MAGRAAVAPPHPELLACTVRMQCLTPTSFRIGNRKLPCPLLTSLYRSLWQKWQHLAPTALRIPEDRQRRFDINNA
jgi:hypothetical protein